MGPDADGGASPRRDAAAVTADALTPAEREAVQDHWARRYLQLHVVRWGRRRGDRHGTPTQVALENRRALIWQLRGEGWTQQEIAERLGVCQTTISDALRVR